VKVGGRAALHATTLMVALLVSDTPSYAWGVQKTHQRLADRALTLANAQGQLDAYLREEYGLRSGLSSELAVIVGLDGPESVDGELARFAQNLGGIWHGSPAPVDSYLLASAPSEVDPIRFPIRHLIRAGVFAEDNPNIRSRHHFLDPAKPPGQHGLDDRERFPGSEIVAESGTIFIPGHGAQYPFGENFDGSGLSARDRALGQAPDGSGSPSAALPPNVFALPDAERYLYRGLVGSSAAEREGSLAYPPPAAGHDEPRARPQ